MDAVRGSFARNTTPNSAPYTTESCFVSSGHSARDHTSMTSYSRALEIAGCQSIETTLRTSKTFVGRDAPPNELRAAAEANRFRKP